MNGKKTFLQDITAENICSILRSMCKAENHQQEMIFPETLIDNICKQKQYPYYIFAYNLEGHAYKRARINRITVEFLVSHKEANVLQIVENGKLIYRKPENPIGKIHVS